MKSFYVVIIISLTIFDISVQAQEAATFKYDGNEFSLEANRFIARHNSLHVYISNHLSVNHFYLHDSLCVSGIALVKFKVSDIGKLIEAAVSKTTPHLLTQALKKALLLSEKYWHGGVKSDRLFIQPIVYSYNMNCKSIKSDLFSLSGGIFEFDDGSSVANKQNIMLEPVIVSSGVRD